MNKRIKVALVGAGAVVAAVASAGIACAVGADDQEAPITGQELEHATAAALERTGGGEVTEAWALTMTHRQAVDESAPESSRARARVTTRGQSASRRSTRPASPRTPRMTPISPYFGGLTTPK